MKAQLLSASIIVATTFVFSTIIMFLMRKVAVHINAMDIPRVEEGHRHIHTKATPKLGGVGIFLAFLLGYMLFGEQSVRMNSILIGSFIIVLTGIFDDIKPISARAKLLGQIASSLVIVFYGNILLNNLTIFGLDIQFGIFAYPITILFIVACTNVINLIDGLDGLSGGISSIFYLSTIVICFFQERFWELELILALIMLGSTLGFLIHNFHPAKIFAGDSGALFMGFTIAIISLLGFKTTAITSVFIPLMILAVPILDTLFAIIRRLLKHQKISTPDKQHLHHQLLKMKFSHRNTVLIIYGITALFSIASILYTLNDNEDIFIGRIIYGILMIIVLIFVFKTDIISSRRTKMKIQKNKKN